MTHIENKKVLAIASAGGHWIQLLRLRPAFEKFDVVYASTSKGNFSEVEGFDFYWIQDATRKTFWNFFTMIFQIFRMLLKIKPQVIVTTGSAPGMMTLAIGKILRIKTVWIDSIANVEKLSTSGSIAKKFADLHLTQWKDLATDGKTKFAGSVL